MAGIAPHFEPNLGQFDPEVAFVARAGGQTLFLTRTGAVVSSSAPSASPRDGQDLPAASDWAAHEEPAEPPRAPGRAVQQATRMNFAAAGLDPQISGEDPLESHSNYFLGSDPDAWRTNVPNYSRVRYSNIYPGIDAVFYGKPGGELEFDFEVAPGRDPGGIALAIDAEGSIHLGDDGSLVAGEGSGALRLAAPVSYQEVEGSWREVDSRFALEGNEIRFDIGDYDSTRTLVIDPSFGYSTYVGGSLGEAVYGIAVDPSGAAYVTGYTNSTNYPRVSQIQSDQPGADVVVTKLAPSGSSLVYSTYLGGSADEYGNGIAVDSAGAAYVCGRVVSTDFPVVSAYQTDQPLEDSFVAKLAPSGSSLAYSTYLGGSDVDRPEAIAVSSLGTAFVTGYTDSTDFPTASPYQTNLAGQDAFVTKLSAAGSSLAYSTYLGGGSVDTGGGIAVDSTGAAYVAGSTSSTDFPTASPYQGNQVGQDVFVTKLNPAGSTLAYSTYLGGSATDGASGIAIDAAGAAYVAGGSTSTDYPTLSPLQTDQGAGDAVVTKLNPAGSTLAYSTYLGGSGIDSASAVAVDASGNAYVSGDTWSTDFPAPSSLQAARAPTDAWVGKLNSAGSSLVYSTYLAGASAEYGYGVAVDTAGAAYVGGGTASADYPLFNQYDTYNGTGDGFVTKVAAPSLPVRANLTTEATQSASPAQRPAVASGGSYVAFHSTAIDLVPGDTNSVGDVFVKRDITGTTERTSVSKGGTEVNGGSRFPAISPDGRYVAFMSDSTNLVTDSIDTNGSEDIYLKDRVTGYAERISISTSGTQAAAGLDSRFPQLSADGRFVVFQTQGALEPADTNGRWDVYVRDRANNTTTRVSVATDGTQATSACARPSISDDGKYVVFHSWASNLVAGDTNGKADIFLRDLAFNTTQRVSISTGGAQGDGDSQFPKISGDGSTVAFHSSATNLVGGDTNGARDTFIRVLFPVSTERVSVSTAGAEADGPTGYAAISENGQRIAFHGTATNLVISDTAGAQDVFVRDRGASSTARVSASAGGHQGDGLSGSAAISADGAYIAFHGVATNLVWRDTNTAQDVFVVGTP